MNVQYLGTNSILVSTDGCAPSPRSRLVKAIPKGKQMQSGFSCFLLMSLLAFYAPVCPSPKEVAPYFWDQDSGWLSLFCRILVLTVPVWFTSLALRWQILLLACFPPPCLCSYTSVCPLGSMTIILIFKLSLSCKMLFVVLQFYRILAHFDSHLILSLLSFGFKASKYYSCLPQCCWTFMGSVDLCFMYN